MTNKEAILVLKSTLVNLGRRSGKTAYAEALEMAITALQELDKNPTKPNNSNDEVNNSTATQSNGIESKVKGLTACRVPEDDTISRRQAIDAFEDTTFTKKEIFRRLSELPSVQPEKRTEERTETHGVCLDAISRQAAIDAILAVTGNSSVRELYEHVQEHGLSDMWSGGVNAAIDIIIAVPSVQTEPLPDAYMKAVWTWLLDYQIKAAELKGRYTPYEVLSWVANDWRKEYEGSD